MKAEAEIETSFWERRHRPASVAVMAALLVILLCLTVWRIERNLAAPSGAFDWSRRGYSDFQNGTYLPTRAFIDGRSPYSTEVAADYDMARAAPPYSPVVFLIHIPFALLSLKFASIAFFLFSVSLVAALAFCSVRMSNQPFRWFDFLAVTNLLLISRPGHITLFTGYFTAEIVIGCIVALHFADRRPVLSGLGITLASIKPNFLIPLMLLMLFRRNGRAVVWGTLFCFITMAIGFGWLSYHNGVQEVIDSVHSGQESLHVDPTEMPINTWTRVDLVGMFAKVANWDPSDIVYVAGMLLIVSGVGFFLRRIVVCERNTGATGPSALIVALTILVGVYHHSYDCLLIAVPMVGLLFFGSSTMPEISPKVRLAIALLGSVAAANYLSTKSAMGYLGLEPLGFQWQAVTLINGFCLTAALVLLIIAAPKQVET